MAPGFWILEDKKLYTAKRRAEDLELVAALWPLQDVKPLMYIKDAPPKIQKKWKKARAAHVGLWRHEMITLQKLTLQLKTAESDETYAWIRKEMISSTTKIIDSMTSSMPSISSHTLVDFSPDFRECQRDGAPDSKAAVSSILVWALYRRAFAKIQSPEYLRQPDSIIHDLQTILSMYPPLRKGDIPNKLELNIRYELAGAVCRQRGWKCYDRAFAHFRACAATARLLTFHDKIEMSDEDDCLITRLDDLVPSTIAAALSIKMYHVGPQLQRPVFPTEERNNLQKELGIGMYTKDNYRCFHCNKTSAQSQLSLCSRCCSAWYCSKACQIASWSGHKRSCGKRTTIFSPSSHTKDDTIERIKAESFWVQTSPETSQLLALCYDAESDQVYDALTDANIEFRDSA